MTVALTYSIRKLSFNKKRTTTNLYEINFLNYSTKELFQEQQQQKTASYQMAKSTSSVSSFTSGTSTSSSSADSSSSSFSKTKKNSNFKASSVQSGPRSSNNNTSSSNLIDRRKRLAANARERKRMHLLNKAYDELRLRLVDAENKSKYDVLVQAKEYIQALAAICENFDKEKEFEQQKAEREQKSATGIPETTTLTTALSIRQQEYLFMRTTPISIETPVDMTLYDCSSPLSTTSSVSSHHSSQLSFSTNASHSPNNITTHHYRPNLPYSTVVHNNNNNQKQQYSTYT